MLPMKRITALLLSGVLLLTAAACKNKQTNSIMPSGEENLNEYQQEFEAFLDEQFILNISEDTISLHYNLRNPEVYGLDDLPVSLGPLSLEEMDESDRLNAEIYAELQAFDIEKLTERQQLAYRAFERHLDIQLESTGLSIYQNMFSKYSGLQVNLPLTLAEYPFYREKDVQDYLILLADVPRYLTDAAEFAKAQAAEGLFIPDSGVSTAVRQIKNFTSDKENNILMTTFLSRIEQVEGLSDEEKQTYIAENTRLVQQTVLPAFTQLGKDLTALKGGSQAEGGLAELERGKEYYKMLLRYRTGSDKSPDELFSLLNRHMTEVSAVIDEIRTRNPQAFTDKDAIVYPQRTPQKILDMLQEDINEEFPPLDNVPYSISYVPEAMEANTSPAFYMNPPFDDITDNSIYINKSSTKDSELFFTLAHEGYPGHLYQSNYFIRTNPHPIMYTTEFTGCKEGWASYVEQLSYHWDPVLEGKDDEIALMIMQSRLNLLIGSTIDIGVNYYGWDVKQTEQFISSLGFDSNVMAYSFFHLSTTNPAYYPSYCIGTLEMLDMRKQAESRLGDLFDAKEFHHAVLAAGPCGFSIIEDEVDKYIEETLSQQSAAQAA